MRKTNKNPCMTVSVAAAAVLLMIGGGPVRCPEAALAAGAGVTGPSAPIPVEEGKPLARGARSEVPDEPAEKTAGVGDDPSVSMAAAAAAIPADPRAMALTAASAAARAAAEAIRQRLARDQVDKRVDELLTNMTVEEKVAQLMFVGFGGRDVEPGGAIEQLLTGMPAGGVALFSRNVEGTEQIAAFTRQIADLYTGIPPFIAVDQEGGNVVRVREPATVLPSNMALGAVADPSLTRRAAATQARDLWLLGFNMNLAPVLDVNSNPVNPVIGIRSFGEDPARVSTHGAAYVEGLQSAGVAAVAKHFPGHGDTQDDSHYALPTLPHGKDRLLQIELAPFKAAIDSGLDAVMTAHIALPEIEGRPDVPATVSREVLTGLLREALEFDGVIITDGLEMQAIADTYGSGAAAVKAFLAGADMMLILWFPEKRQEVYRALLEAARDGTISAARLDQSVRRILSLKVRRGLFDRPPPPLPEALATLGDGEHGRGIADEIAARALTLIRGAPGLTPIDTGRYERIVVVSSNRAFSAEMSARFPNARMLHTPAVPSAQRRRGDLATAQRLARSADLLVLGVMNRHQVPIVRALGSADAPRIVVSMGSPYMLGDFPDVEAYLATYSYQAPSGRAAARFLAGDIAAQGRLPVSLPGLYPLGHTAARGEDED